MDYPAAIDVVNQLKLLGIRAVAYKVDVSNHDEVEQLRLNIEQDLGPVNILINNAALLPLTSFREGPWTDRKRILEVNIHSHFWMIRNFLTGMIDRKDGHIVAISSVAGLLPAPYTATYTASKHAVTGLMACVTEDIYFDGHHDYIKTTCAYPYFINTRKSVMDVVLTNRFPPMTPEYAASTIVDAMLKDQEHIIVARFAFLFSLFLITPTSIRRIITEKFYPDVLDNLRQHRVKHNDSF